MRQTHVESNAHYEKPQPSIGEHVLSGLLASLLLAVGDVCVIFTDHARLPRAYTVLRAMLDEWALIAIFGVATGLLSGLVARALYEAKWFAGVRQRLLEPRRWFVVDATGFAGSVAALLSAGIVLLIAWRTYKVVSVAFAQQHFAALAMALTALGLVVVALLLFALLTMLLRPVSRVIGVFATPGTVLVLLLCTVGVGIFFARLYLAQIFQNGLWRQYAPLPMIALAYLVARVLMRLVMRTRFVRVRKARVPHFAWGAFAASVGLFVWVGFNYGRLQSVREVVERRAIVGDAIVHSYMRFFDRDRDGYSALFADADCNDRRADIHPGAVDVRGDHIDSDCFGGDGSPNVSPFGDGDFGPLPHGLHRPNIVLVTVDALRADHLSTYGYGRHTSPRIDELARTSTRFTDVLAPSSRTVAAMPSIMTGFYPSQIARGTQYFYPALLPQNHTIAESLKDAGYRTVAIAGTYFFGRVEGYFQGFDVVEQVSNFHSTREWPVDTTIANIDRMREGTAPWFVWVHLFNVHADYLGDNHGSMYGQGLVDKYDTEVALMDQEIGRLVDALHERHLTDNTAIIFSSDHGEAFGEHGTFFHETLYDEELRPPLLVHLPNGRGRVSRAPVSTIDIAPTILNLANVRVPTPMPARSLIPLLDGSAGDATRVRFAERLPDGWASINQKAIYRGFLKLLWFVEDGRLELYDHQSDPREQVNLADDRVDDTNRMLGELRAWASQTASNTMRDEDIVRANRLRRAPAHMDHRMGTRYTGLFTVLGYDLPRTTFAPGESIPFNFYYRVDQETDRELMFEVLFDVPEGFPNVEWFHGKHLPILSRYPTSQWRAGEILRDPVVIPIPTFAPSGARIHVRFRVMDHGVVVPYEGDTSGTGVVNLPDIEIR